MKHDDENIDERLAELGRATEAIRPRADFGARVMRALDAERPVGWFYDVRKPARRLLPALAFAAALSVFMAVESESAFDDALASFPDDTVELEW